MEIDKTRTNALLKAFELITLYRAYYLSDINWGVITQEYAGIVEQFENKEIQKDAMDVLIHTFDEKYPFNPKLSSLIDICRDRHDIAHSGNIKTILKQEKFIDECCKFFKKLNIMKDEEGIFGTMKAICEQLTNELVEMKGRGELKKL